MVNNSTNINKTKESLNSAGQQFHQHQLNEQSPLISTRIATGDLVIKKKKVGIPLTSLTLPHLLACP
jgi:hypothetical protein